MNTKELWHEVDADSGVFEAVRLERGRILKHIRAQSEQSFRSGLAARDISFEDGEALIRNYERYEVLQ